MSETPPNKTKVIHEAPQLNFSLIDSLAGEDLGRYEQLITLGEGGMGTVYKAWDSKLKIHVAVKVLPTKLAASSNMVERFNREAQVLASLNLPGVVRIFDINQERGYHFYTMELVKGDNLKIYALENTLNLENKISIIKQLAKILKDIHDRGVVHRDIKPENIMIAANLRVVLTDFGLAKSTENNSGFPQVTKHDTYCGTPRYMSPDSPKELRQDLNLAKKSDMFSFGIVCYELIAEKLPFAIEDLSIKDAIIHMSTVPPEELKVKDVPSSLEKVIMSCLKIQSDERPSATEFLKIFTEKKASSQIPILLLTFLLSIYSIYLLYKFSPPPKVKKIKIISQGILQGKDYKHFQFHGLDMHEIPGGEFTMGNNLGRAEEQPEHQRRLNYNFWMLRTEVTVAEYNLGHAPSSPAVQSLPQNNVSWWDAMTYCAKLNDLSHQSKDLSFVKQDYEFRLPTEQEWEYACRFGDSSIWLPMDKGTSQGHVEANSAIPVQSFQPNKLGIYDLKGNLLEWCLDSAKVDNNEIKTPSYRSPVNYHSQGESRILRGGAWNFKAHRATATARFHQPPSTKKEYIGFRVVYAPKLENIPQKP